ncbi:MAG: HEAT repeat domain-containing protein [Myxococcota bacterium]|jgi:HEAT repeat protein|nr:HEAT repeat domain-containing protein [Myxococcota bacterium]
MEPDVLKHRVRSYPDLFSPRALTGAPLALLLTLLYPCVALAAPSPEQIEAFRLSAEASLSSEQAEVRYLGVLTLGALLQDKDQIKAFKKYTQDADRVVKVGALLALAKRADKDALTQIEKEITSAEDPDAILSELLSALGEQTQHDILSKILKKQKDEKLLQAIYRYVARSRSEKLFSLLKVDGIKAAEQRNTLLSILAQSPDPLALTIATTQASSKDASTRLAALQLAKAIGGRDARDLIAKAIDDGDDSVRDFARSESLASKHPAIVPSLEAKLQEDPKDFETIKLLLQFENVDVSASLAPVVSPENPKLELEDYILALSLFAASKSPEAVALLDKKLASTFVSDRTAAACALGFTEDKSFTPKLAALVVDGAVEIRRCAASSYGLLKDPAAIDTISKVLGSEFDPQTKLSLIHSLGQIGDPAAISSLQLLMLERDDELRLAALSALAALKALSAATAIEMVAEDSSPKMRWAAVLTLFLIDPVVYGERLKRSVADAPEEAFFEAMDTLSPEMQLKLQEEVFRGTRSSLALRIVERYAAQGIDGLGALRNAFDLSTDPSVRQVIFSQLARYGEATDLKRFEAILDNTKERSVRLAALRTILGLELSLTETILARFVDSDDPLMKMLAIYGLTRAS